MTVESPAAFNQNGTYSAARLRQLLASLQGPGVALAADLAVTANGTPDMSVNVAAGAAWVAGTDAGQGDYFFRNDAVINVGVTASNPSNPRNDLVIARIRDLDYSGAADDADLVIVVGTPAASPVDPTVPRDSLALARIRVDAAVASIVSGKITDLRQLSFPSAAARGEIGRTPVTSSSGSTGTELTIATSPALLLPAGRRLKITGHAASIGGTVIGDTFNLNIKEGATFLGEKTIRISGGSDGTGVIAWVNPGAGSHTYTMTLKKTSGTGSGNVVASADAPAVISVEDVGPA